MPVATQPTTSPMSSVEAPPAAEPEIARADWLYRLSLDQYHRMADAGILDEDDRVELIEGLLVKKMSRKPPHILAAELLNRILNRLVPEGWYVSIQNPIALAESGSEPEPNVKIVRGDPHDYGDRQVTPGDSALVIEVSDSTLRDDQVVKKAIYARSSVPVYWIVNIPARRIAVYTDPTGSDPRPDYRQRLDFGPEEMVRLVLDGREVAQIAVADLMPRN
jgi:Uma2 family endonuclease